MTEVNQPSDIKEGEFALVKFSARKSVQCYVGDVSDVFEDGDETFKFLKRSSHFKLASERPWFIFSMDTDESEFTQNLKDIVFKFPVPFNRRGTKRCQQKFVFPVYLSGYNLQ